MLDCEEHVPYMGYYEHTANKQIVNVGGLPIEVTTVDRCGSSGGPIYHSLSFCDTRHIINFLFKRAYPKLNDDNFLSVINRMANDPLHYKAFIDSYTTFDINPTTLTSANGTCSGELILGAKHDSLFTIFDKMYSDSGKITHVFKINGNNVYVDSSYTLKTYELDLIPLCDEYCLVEGKLHHIDDDLVVKRVYPSTTIMERIIKNTGKIHQNLIKNNKFDLYWKNDDRGIDQAKIDTYHVYHRISGGDSNAYRS